MDHEGPDDRTVLMESLKEMVSDRELEMQIAGLNPDRNEVLDAVWNSLVQGKTEALKRGISEEKLERDLLTFFDLIEELREGLGPVRERGEGEIEFLKQMAPLISRGIARRIARQERDGESVSRLRAIDEEEEAILSNADALFRFTEHDIHAIERRKEYLRIYFRGLRNEARRH